MLRPSPRRTAIQAVISVAVAVITAATIVIVMGPSATTPSSSRAQRTSTSTAISVPTTAPPPALSVRGTRFVDAAGNQVTLVGAARESLEYLCAGDGHFTPADFQAMRRWGMNIVRITLSSEFWAGAGGQCPNYHQTVIQAVANAESEGLYVMLALQWDAPFDTPHDRAYGGVQCPMPDNQKDVTMWRDLATIYRGDQRVLFDLFSEPHDVSWNVWLNGGLIANAKCYLINRNGGLETGTYQAIGMRDLVAAVRAIAPSNIVVVSGLDWGYQLDQLPSYALTGSNIVYSTHPFNYQGKQAANWPGDFGDVAATFPVIAAEFGSYDCGTSFNRQIIAYFNAQHISWLAWAWNVGDCTGPSLLASWSGTPSQPYGAFIQQQMLALSH